MSNSDLKSKMMVLSNDSKIASINVKVILCDNASKNKALFDKCISKGINIIFDFSGPRTSQKNDKVERKF